MPWAIFMQLSPEFQGSAPACRHAPGTVRRSSFQGDKSAAKLFVRAYRVVYANQPLLSIETFEHDDKNSGYAHHDEGPLATCFDCRPFELCITVELGQRRNLRQQLRGVRVARGNDRRP